MSPHGGQEAEHRHGHRFPAHEWERLLSAERHALLDPARVLDLAGVRAGMTVADLGAGPGYFTLPLARRVGETGTVYATDVSPEMLEVLVARGLPPHVRPVLAGESHFDIPDGVVDLALLAFVLHEIAHPTAFLREVRRILGPAGRLVVLEWKPQVEETGPPLHERLSVARSAELLAAGGFEVTDEGEANASHYYMLTRPEQPPAPDR
ncbi:MAG: class I SAM-dependent methyltransferase [Gemmatimonadaceae bacterium]